MIIIHLFIYRPRKVIDVPYCVYCTHMIIIHLFVCRPMKVVDVCIRRLLKQRATLLPPTLNPEDVFFREV